MKSIETDGRLICYPTGRIDSSNAAAFERELTQNAYVNLTTVRACNCRKVLGLELEQAVYVRDHLFPMYFGDIDPASLERKMTVIEAMHTVRFLLIAFLQGWDHLPDDFDNVLVRARAEFFPRIDELCALIESEF